MKKDLILICAIIALSFVSRLEAKGGGHGRSHGGSHGGSGGGWRKLFGGSSKSSSGNSGSSSRSSSGSNSRNTPHYSSAHENSHTGGWFQGLIHTSPYHYSYRPVYLGRSYHSSYSGQGNSYGNGNYGEEQQKASNADVVTDPPLPESSKNDATNYAVGYTISKALSNDFFSLFNVVHDISKYPKQIENTAHRMSLTSTSTTTSPFENTSSFSSTSTEKPKNYDDQSHLAKEENWVFSSSPINQHLPPGDFNQFMQTLFGSGAISNDLDSTTQKFDYISMNNFGHLNISGNPSPQDLEKELSKWIKSANKKFK